MNLYEGFDSGAVHTAISLESKSKTSYTSMKFHIPVIMPSIPSGTPKVVNNKINKSNIKNKDKSVLALGTTVSTCNYVELSIPKYIQDSLPTGTVPKGLTFFIVFIGGDINHIRVIGRE